MSGSQVPSSNSSFIDYRNYLCLGLSLTSRSDCYIRLQSLRILLLRESPSAHDTWIRRSNFVPFKRLQSVDFLKATLKAKNLFTLNLFRCAHLENGKNRHLIRFSWVIGPLTPIWVLEKPWHLESPVPLIRKNEKSPSNRRCPVVDSDQLPDPWSGSINSLRFPVKIWGWDYSTERFDTSAIAHQSLSPSEIISDSRTSYRVV